jgi:hypothetical protein
MEIDLREPHSGEALHTFKYPEDKVGGALVLNADSIESKLQRPIWQADVRSYLDQLHSIWQIVRDRTGADGLLLSQAQVCLSNGYYALECGRGRWARMSGAILDTAYANAHEADSHLLALRTPAEASARSNEVLTLCQRYLPPHDIQRKSVESHLKVNAAWNDKDQVDSRQLAASLRAAYAACDREHRSLRSFRNGAVLLMLVATAVCAAVGLLGLHAPSLLQVCFQPQGRAVCLSGPNAGPWDLTLVLLLGLVGAVFTGASSLYGEPSNGTSYSHLAILLTIVKLPLGALTAVAGLLFIHAGFLPGFTDLDTSSQIAAWAIAFGAAQHAISRLLDLQARRLVSQASGRSQRNEASKVTRQ